ncbi:MAG: hypothetical protein IJU95_08855 [Treponema sp.]|nr:hypothetical protein [Treponema sp.]
MIIKKLAACVAVAAVLVLGAAAQDDWGDDAFGSDSFSDGSDSFGGDDDWGSFDSGDSSSGLFGGLPITFSGRLTFDGRYYFAKDDSEYFGYTKINDTRFPENHLLYLDTTKLAFTKNNLLTTMIPWGDTYPKVEDLTDDMENYYEEIGYSKVDYADNTLKASPAARLGIGYSGDRADANLVLNLTENTLKNYQQDIIDELLLRGYFIDSRLKIEAGKMKLVWGKGDKLHVLDNFNADDYTDFIIPDYIDRRIATPMLRAVYSFNTASPFSMEAVWTPFLPTDRFAKEGMWMPASYAKLKYITQSALLWNFSRTLDLTSLTSFDEDDLYADTNSLKYSQGGFKVAGTAGPLDWGVSYYFGRYKQPSANLDDMLTPIAKIIAYKQAVESYTAAAEAAIKANNNAAAANYAALASEAGRNAQELLNKPIGLPSLDYDRKQTVGLEFATVIGRFNLRGEAGFNVTEDWAGDDPWVHNNSVQWLFGFDFDLPVSNLNVNIQETGTYILNSGDIEDGLFKEFDVDYDPKDRYTNDKLVVNISDSWLNDRLKPEVTLMWGIERGDFVLQPKFTFAPNPNLAFTLSGMMIYAKDEYSEFYSWKNNNFVNLGVKFEF